jgi:hypothetical protein
VQFLCTSAGGGVAVMEAEETQVIERALSRYVLENPESHLAVRLLAGLSRAIEGRAGGGPAEGDAPA